ncbi:MAG: glycosyltransferase [Clostridia bacterium]|nr:glycosyltransferase [Clostridia bacterium]
MSEFIMKTEFNDEELPFSFTTALYGDRLICSIEPPREDVKFLCYLLYEKDKTRTPFYKDRAFSSEKTREFDLSALLSEDDLPARITVKIYISDDAQKKSVMGDSFYYPLPTGPKITAVIPVYNAKEYIAETLRSVSAQTHLNSEFIFIDRLSSDGSYELLKEFAKTERRAKVLKQRARLPHDDKNTGLERASGDYIIFLEAGDMFSPHLLSEAAARAEDTDADVVVFAAERFDAAKDETTPMPEVCDTRRCPKDAPVFSKKSGDIFNFTRPVLYNKLFKREFLQSHGLSFPAHLNDADAVFTYTALALAESIAPLDRVLLSHTGQGEKKADERYAADPTSSVLTVSELKKSLANHGVYAEAEAPFLRFALPHLMRSLESARDFEGFKTAYTALKQFGMKELGFLEKPSDFYPEESRKYYNKAEALLRYSEYDYIKAFGLERLISHRLILPPEYAKESAPQPRVTVVVPVYNTEKYLAECLDSILASTMRDFELICLNDGSTDRSLEIMKEYQKKDGRIIIFDAPENHGLAATRNVAFDHARGEYICCVDSDDLITPDHLEKTYEYAKRYDLDMLFFDAVPFYENEEMEKNFSAEGAIYTSTIDLSIPRTGRQMLTDMMKTKTYRSNMCLQLIKREHLDAKKLRLYPGLIYEDVLFTFVSLLRAGLCARLSHPYYRRRFREGSIIMEKKDFCHIQSYILIAAEMMTEIRRAFPSREEEELFFIRVRSVAKSMNTAYEALSEDEQKEFTERYLTPVEAIWFKSIRDISK